MSDLISQIANSAEFEGLNPIVVITSSAFSTAYRAESPDTDLTEFSMAVTLNELIAIFRFESRSLTHRLHTPACLIGVLLASLLQITDYRLKQERDPPCLKIS